MTPRANNPLATSTISCWCRTTKSLASRLTQWDCLEQFLLAWLHQRLPEIVFSGHFVRFPADAVSPRNVKLL
jgi:hypothetical protein